VELMGTWDMDKKKGRISNAVAGNGGAKVSGGEKITGKDQTARHQKKGRKAMAAREQEQKAREKGEPKGVQI